MKKLSPIEEKEAFEGLVAHYGMYVLLEKIDVIINRIRDGIHGCNLSNDPVKDGQLLLGERRKLEGALALKNALMVEIQNAKPKGK